MIHAGQDPQLLDPRLDDHENWDIVGRVCGKTQQELDQYARREREIMQQQPIGTFSNVGVTNIRIDLIDPLFLRDVGDLYDLIATISERGLIDPLKVRPHHMPEREGRYQLYVGYRRWMALSEIGSPTAPCIVRDVDDQTAYELSAIENLVRKDWNTIEEAKHYQKWMGLGASQQQIAGKIGKSQTYVSQKLEHLYLLEEVQNYIAEGRLAEAYGHVLYRYRETLNSQGQTFFAERAIALGKKYSARKMENEIRQHLEIPSEERREERTVCRKILQMYAETEEKIINLIREKNWQLHPLACPTCKAFPVCKKAARHNEYVIENQ